MISLTSLSLKWFIRKKGGRNVDLKNIGFYTLSDKRAATTSVTSRLSRCELILTSRCNFKCPYCRGVKNDDKGDISKEDAFGIVEQWASDNLRCIRFSGGEPTLWPHLQELVIYTKELGIERIALSTNGSADIQVYCGLIASGVNDLSISLDSCCASTGNKMAGKEGVFDTIVSNITELSKLTYVTVGVVLTPDNYQEINDIVSFASSLGVADIRVIPAAQLSKEFENLRVDDDILNVHPILKYRYGNFVSGKGVRGLTESDNHQCPLVLDDMAVLNGQHYPCIIYMREHGDPIGKINGSIKTVRKERKQWFDTHDCFKDPICQGNCLDVCVDYNNKVKSLTIR